MSQIRAGDPSRWLVALSTVVLLSSAAALAIVMVRYASSTSAFGLEVDRQLLITDLEAAVLVEADIAVELVSGMVADGSLEDAGPGGTTGFAADGMDDMGMDDMGSHLSPAALSDMTASELAAAMSLSHHGGGTDAANDFAAIVQRLRGITPDQGLKRLDEVVSLQQTFLTSIAQLDAQSHQASISMAFYHSDTQVAEVALRGDVQALYREALLGLEQAVADTRVAEGLLRVVTPVVLIAGIIAVLSLVRAQATKRRVATLERLVAEKDEFIASVGHRLKTPLTSIIGFVDMLRDPNGAFDQRERDEFLATIAHESQLIGGTVEDLEVAARNQNGGLVVVSERVDLLAETQKALQTLSEARADMEIIGPALPAVRGDSARVRQILRNLLTNAERHGTGEIRVETGIELGEGCIRVSSSGPPISEVDEARIFAFCERGYDTPGLVAELGIGLAVSCELARRMGGDVTYLRKDGLNVFQLSLPCDPLKPGESRIFAFGAEQPSIGTHREGAVGTVH